ncbi:MAG: hypothetical protein U0263_07800 [Polyangiaceae bacterium]
MTRRRIESRWLCATGSAFLLALGACSSSTSSGGTGSDVPPENLGVSCDGKCDGWGSITSLWRDAKKLDLGDLMNVSAGFATDQLNDALTVSDYAGIKLSEPKVYATGAKAQNDLTLGNLDKLVTGLAVAYGERELTTEVNQLRRDHLTSGAASVYGEFAFQLSAAFGHNWGLSAGGLAGANVNVGFDLGANLKARVIAPFDSEAKALGGAPLAALKGGRGFVVPRSAADVRAMKPGELLALSGSGAIGLNLGVGVPLLVATPAAGVSYNLVLSGGLRAHLSGQMDVQLVRLGGDAVVVDVGVSSAKVKSASIALTDGWGIQGLVKTKMTLGGIDVDLGRLVEKALQNQMNAKLSFIEARAAKTKQETRLSVARLRFKLDSGSDPKLTEQALAQALKGDIRLAQALSAQGEPGVVAEFDLSRSGVSATSNAGIDIFGMSFFKNIEETQGSVVVQTPGGARTILFDGLHKQTGYFFSSHGYTRVGVSGLVFDPANPSVPAQGEANLFLQLEEGDDYMERDKLLDHLDAVIQSVGGKEALAAIEKPGNELQRYVVTACPNSQAFDPCRLSVLDDPKVVQLRADGASALEQAVAGLEPAAKDLVMKAGTLRLTAQATLEPAAALVGPPSSVVVDLRLDDKALASMFSGKTEYDLKNALTAYLRAVLVDRGASESAIVSQRAKIPSANDSAVLSSMAAEYKTRALSYEKLMAAEKALIQNVGAVGPRTVEIRFPVDATNRPDYEKATAGSLAQARAREALALYDKLLSLADGLDPHAEQPVLYALLSLTSPNAADLRLNVQMDTQNNWAQSFEHYKKAGYAGFNAYAKGSLVAPIDGGLFDVNALLNVK